MMGIGRDMTKTPRKEKYNNTIIGIGKDLKQVFKSWLKIVNYSTSSKTFPKSSFEMNRTSVRFYEMGDMTISSS